MAPINISRQDRIYLERIVATEADHSLAKSNPELYRKQVAGIVDTVLNRVASPQFPDTIAGVANQPSQFSAINGPSDRNYTVYGSVQDVPDSIVPAAAKVAVNDWVNARIGGAPSSVGGGLHYANPHFSDAKNLVWIEALDGPRFGEGNSIHYHGTTAGFEPVEAQVAGDFYSADGVKLPPGEVPNIVASELSVTPTQHSTPPSMPTPVEYRPRPMVTMPTPASERPRSTVPVEAAQRLLPTIGPTGIIAQDEIGQGAHFGDVAGMAFRRQPGINREEAEAATTRVPVTPQLDGDGNIRSYHIPAGEMVPTVVTGGLGSLTPNPATETRPGEIPSEAMRQPTRPVASNGGYAGQERAPPKENPGVRRTADPMAGSVALPRDVRPDAATELTRQAESAQTRAELARQPPSFAGQDAGPKQIVAPRPVSRASAPQSFAGQERGPVTSRTEAPPPNTAPSTGPNIGPRPRQPPTAPSGAPPNIGPRPRNTPTSAAPVAPVDSTVGAAAASPADIPKYITRTERIEIPQRYAGQDGAKQTPKGRDGIPLGDIIHSGSRDSKAQSAAGIKAADALGDQLRNPEQGPMYKTRTITTLNPDWVETNTPKPPAAKPVEQPADHGYGILGDVRQFMGLPAGGIGLGIVNGVRDMFRGGAQRVSQPLSQAQITAANANSRNHNAAALAAINQGKRSYTSGGGTLMPTTTMDGKVRNTYGDTGGSLVG